MRCEKVKGKRRAVRCEKVKGEGSAREKAHLYTQNPGESFSPGFYQRLPYSRIIPFSAQVFIVSSSQMLA